MKVVALVPIKTNNERLPGKNTKKFDDGTPLCDLLFGTLSNVNNIDEKYCFCSDENIRDFLPEEIKFVKRSKELDRSVTSINEVISAFIDAVDADYYVLLHTTSPFIEKRTIEKCVEVVISKEYDSALSVLRLSDFFWDSKGPVNFDPSNIKRTQDLEPFYKETSGVYVFSKTLFRSTNRRVGFNPFFCNVSLTESVDINDAEEFEIANAIHMKANSKHNIMSN